MTPFPRITRDPEIMSGRACIRDSHVTASTLLALLAVGRSHEEIVRMFPTLTPEDLRETLAYAAWWIDEQSPHSAPEADPSPPVLAEPLPEPEPPLPSPPVSQPEEPEASFLLQPFPEELPATEETPQNGATENEPREEEVMENADMEEGDMEASSDENQEPEEVLELFHPDYPDQATVVITRHGIYDRRWGTHTIAWSDIREIHRKSSKKTVDIILRNPEFYVTSMPFFKRLHAQIKMAFNIQTLHLDTASLGIRTKDLYLAANRLWVRHRGRVRFRKKRRVRVNGKSDDSRRTVEWDRYQPM